MLKTVSGQRSGLIGQIIIPSDKSISHRAVMFSSLAHGECIISNFSSGADCRSTLNLFRELGVNIQFTDEKTVKVASHGSLSEPQIPLYAGNSGTTMRLASGILAGQKFNSVITGDESLTKRPMKRIIEPLTQMGAIIDSDNGHAPLHIQGAQLCGIDYSSNLSSAQVKSCVLLAGLNAKGKTTYKEPYLSRNHTELMLKYLGAKISRNGNAVTIEPSELTAKDISVVGDISSAAFFITAGLIVPNSDFLIQNVGVNPTRTGILDIVNRMGGDIEILNLRDVSGEKCADLRIRYTENLKACEICGEDIPRLIDELPVIAVLASQADGCTTIKDAQDLRNKESDRIKCIVSELTKIGVKISETQDGFIINEDSKKSEIKGGAELYTYHDHRLAMSFYVAGLIAKKEITINGFEWTEISFPEFEQLFCRLQKV